MEFTAETIARALTAIYGKEFDIDSELEAHIFGETRRIFAQAVAEGIADSVEGGADVPGDEFLKALRESVDVFSAFRTHRMQNDIAAQLTDEKGQLKPFSRFAKDVRPYVSHKNRAWLRTEYDTAIRRAHQAADWQQFEAEKDVLPNLEWIPSTSPTPGADHRVFWGTVLPVDDPFWKEHRPGDRWNCKCELRQTDKDTTPVPAGTGKDAPHSGLENNPGSDGHLFSQNHPYFPKSCVSCPYSGNKLFALFSDLAGRKDCFHCGKVDRVIEGTDTRKEANREEYERLKRDPDYIDVKYDKKSGGVKGAHKGHIDHSDEKPIFMGLNPTQLENACQDELFHMGHSAIFCNESIQTIKGQNDTALDLLLDGKRMDIASVTKDVITYRNIFLGKNKQLHRFNHLPYVEEKADAVCLYFHDPKMFSEQKVMDGMERLKEMRYTDKETGEEKSVKVAIKHVYCVVRGSDKLYQYDFDK